MTNAQKAKLHVLKVLVELRELQPESQLDHIVTYGGRIGPQNLRTGGEIETLFQKLEEEGVGIFVVSSSGITWNDNRVEIRNIDWIKVEEEIKKLEPSNENEQENESKQASSELFEILKISEVNFRKLFRDKPSSEKEVQDKYEDMLNSRDIPFSREKDSIEYSSKTYKPDFTFSDLDLAVEIKLCDNPKREKEMIAEINDDVLAYKTKWNNILFVIYDLGFIRDVDLFKKSFEKQEYVIVQVIKH